MDKSIIIALVSSTVALIVSIFNGIINILSTRQSQRHSRELHRYKSIRTLADSENTKLIGAINDGISLIQSLKDVISIIYQAVPSSIDDSEQKEQLFAAINKLIESFDDNDPYLLPSQRKPFHAAKDNAILLMKEIKDVDDLSQLPDELRNKLLDIRHDLSDSQDQLRDFKWDIRLKMENSDERKL